MLKLWRQSYLFSCALNWSKFLCVVFSIGLPRSYGLISTILFFFKQNVFEDNKQICNLEKICKCLDEIHFFIWFWNYFEKEIEIINAPANIFNSKLFRNIGNWHWRKGERGGIPLLVSYLAISLSISCSNWTSIGASIPNLAPRLATSNKVKITCFSFFLHTKSSVSNMMHSITPRKFRQMIIF